MLLTDLAKATLQCVKIISLVVTYDVLFITSTNYKGPATHHGPAAHNCHPPPPIPSAEPCKLLTVGSDRY